MSSLMLPPDEHGFAVAIFHIPAPDGRLVIGWQKNAEGTFDRVFSDGSGRTPVTSPLLQAAMPHNPTGEEG